MPADFDGLHCQCCGASTLATEEGHRYCAHVGDGDCPIGACAWGLEEHHPSGLCSRRRRAQEANAKAERERTVAHLRSLPAAELQTLLGEAKVAVGWWNGLLRGLGADTAGIIEHRPLRRPPEDYRPYEWRLIDSMGDTLADGEATTRDVARTAVEDAAIAAGWRVPWRN